MIFGLNFLFFFPTRRVSYTVAHMKVIKLKKYEILMNCFCKSYFSKVGKSSFEQIHFFSCHRGAV